MLLYRGFIETKVRFLFALPALLMVCIISLRQFTSHAAGSNAANTPPLVSPFIMLQGTIEPGLMSFIWSRWDAGAALMLLPLLANAIASTGIVPHGGCFRGRGKIEPSATAFALTLPARRRDILLWTAAAGMLQVGLLALAPQLLIQSFAVYNGGRFALGDAIAFAFIETVACLVPYALGLIVTSLIDDDMNSRMAGMVPLLAIFMVEQHFKFGLPMEYYRVLSGASYFTSGQLPWTGLAICAILATPLVWLATELVERRDY